MRATTRPVLLLAVVALGTACPPSPGRIEGGNTPVEVAGHTLEPRSALMFSGESSYDVLVVMVADHPAVCGEMGSLDACALEADLFNRGTIGPPRSVGTALVVSARPAATGTFGIAPTCYLGTSAQVSFVVRDEAGGEILRDEAIQGTVTIEELEPGVRASGRFDVVLGSGASASGRFVGAFCSAVSAFAVIPPHRTCARSSSESYVNESCSCRGQSVASACSRSTASEPWTCVCADAQGGTSTCTLPADTPRSSCPSQSLTCCPMLL